MPNELLAGATLAALAIPEVMGYTKIAGTPVVTGLYTLLIPLALFALFGSSRHLVVGADSATAAMLAAGLAGLATTGSPEYVALAGVLALMAAGFLFVGRVVGLGFLSDFLSRTVLIGFLTGVGVQVALGQIPGMLGIPGDGLGSLGQALSLGRHLDQTNPYALGLSACVLGVVLVAKRVGKRTPGPLLAIVGATLAAWGLDLGAQGLRLVGTVPSGLPRIGLPQVAWSWSLLEQLSVTAFGMSIVILAQSAATSRAYAARYDERVSEGGDLVGLGVANLGAALSGTFVVNGSPTKTQMVDTAGGRTQLAQLFTAGIVLLVLLFLTGPLAYLPDAALAAVVFLVGLEMIDLGGLKRIYAERRMEFWVALTTAAVVVLWNVQQGILLAIFLSLVAHTRHGYRPKNTVLVEGDDGRWRELPVSAPAQARPGLLVYRFTHSMYYANAGQLAAQLQALVKAADPPLEWLCIACGAVDDVDFTAAETLRSLQELLAGRGVRLVLTSVSDHVRAELDASGLTERVGADAYYASIGDVVDAYGARPPADPAP